MLHVLGRRQLLCLRSSVQACVVWSVVADEIEQRSCIKENRCTGSGKASQDDTKQGAVFAPNY